MKALILAAGQGSRLLPLTKNVPKCMIEVLGQPIIYWIYNALKANKINDITVITGYKRRVVDRYLKELDSSIKIIHQKQLTGTANAVGLFEDTDENFLVLAGDTIFYADDINKLKQKSNSLLFTKWDDRLFELGTLNIKGQIIREIVEKNKHPVSKMVNISAYHFTPDIFKYIDDTPYIRGERTITYTINKMVSNGYIFNAIEVDNWHHISYPEDIKKVEEDLYES